MNLEDVLACAYGVLCCCPLWGALLSLRRSLQSENLNQNRKAYCKALCKQVVLAAKLTEFDVVGSPMHRVIWHIPADDHVMTLRSFIYSGCALVQPGSDFQGTKLAPVLYVKQQLFGLFSKALGHLVACFWGLRQALD